MKRRTTVSQEDFNQQLMSFIQASPTPYHAVASMEAELAKNGYKKLEEKDAWLLAAGGKYFVSRNGSAIIAFKLAQGDRVKAGFHIVGAHTDSPCPKIKPNPITRHKSLVRLGVELYGGMRLSTWFDRPLSIAGRVTYANKKGEIKSSLIDFQRPMAVIPNLGIHLEKSVDALRDTDKQKEFQALFLNIDPKKKVDFSEALLQEIKKQSYAKDFSKLLSYDLSLYEVSGPVLVGGQGEFLSAGRSDNLSCCFVGMKSLIEGAGVHATSVLVCNDHEEVGSSSAVGAAGIFLKSVLKRICGSGENFARAISQSYLISSDNAHAEHPAFPDAHDSNHTPVLDGGPVIKVNSNQKYATTSETAALFKQMCLKAKVPVQTFVSNNNSRCGTTIGPITSTVLGIRTVDVGLPMLAMHSVRELMGVKDALYLWKALREFYSNLS